MKITDEHLKLLLDGAGSPSAYISGITKELAEDLREARSQLALVRKFCCIHQKDAGCIGPSCPGWAAGRAVNGTKVLKLLEERLVAAERVCERANCVKEEANDRSLDEALDVWLSIASPNGTGLSRKLTPEEEAEREALDDEEVLERPHGPDCCCQRCNRMRELGSILKNP